MKTPSDNEARLLSLTHDLFERVKELRCLYGISSLVENRDLSIDEIFEGVVNLIPPAWQYPEITGACISLNNKRFQTPNFKDTPWKQVEAIIVNGNKVGTLVVNYSQKKPPMYEGPFLKEERQLIHVIAERLGNIIEYKNAEKSIRLLYEREKRLRKKLQIEIQNRVDFSRKLIHELKTPLTSLMATSQLLFEETQGTKLGKVAGFVWDGSNRLNCRIDELHDVVRGEIGTLKLKPKPIDIARLLSSLTDETGALSRQLGMSITLEVDKPLPKVNADAERIKQVMLNLINNACKYAREGKRVNIRGTRDSSSMVKIEVQDYGPGISRDRQRVLFKPGYQLRQRSENTGGLGIGLTLCKMLVKLHGGKIWVESNPGEGSSFFFTLPVADSK